MSNVYVRNRKKSQYEKFLINKKIQKELLQMNKVKDKRYFPAEFNNVYIELIKLNDSIVEQLAFVYSERVRNSAEKSTDSLTRVITSMNTAIDLCEASIQILQNYYMNRGLHKKTVSKKELKVGTRFQKMIELFIIESEELKSYLKTLKKKLKELEKTRK